MHILFVFLLFFLKGKTNKSSGGTLITLSLIFLDASNNGRPLIVLIKGIDNYWATILLNCASRIERCQGITFNDKSPVAL